MRTLGNFFLALLIITAFLELVEVSPQQTTQCGVREFNNSKRRKRVIGGTTARNNSWPWLVNMIDKNDGTQQCSGVIIDRQWILTTAHCFIYSESEKNVTTFLIAKYKYIVADHRLNLTDPYEFTVEPSQLFVHPNYKLGDSFQPGDYDVALLKLKKPIQFTRQVKPACMPKNTTVFLANASCYLTGWGNTANTDHYNRSTVLRKVQLKFVSLHDCNSKAAYNGIIPERFRCAGYATGGMDGCYGDSGAPLQCYVGEKWTVAGLMSWGMECGKPNHYGVYTDVQKFSSTFIQPVLEGSVDRLTTYHKRRLNNFRSNWRVEQISLYLLFTRNNTFTDIELVRNIQPNPLHIKLMKAVTLTDYAFVKNTSVANILSCSTPLSQIVAGFQQNYKKLENYDKIKAYGMMKNKSVVEVIKMAGVPKSTLLNAANRFLNL